ncbi:peptidylprolyl isomerase [Seohaeicola saemankumensis]|jgi:peptidyl-prolyl cis-trans isomerase C|uniref:peptidylprolyl isomerase n=1 Tax=Seohaeicola TaxID=481178 RepID=UPI0035D10467|nr:peptidylprolyl isomerase [Paracoccaceae bacterium]
MQKLHRNAFTSLSAAVFAVWAAGPVLAQDTPDADSVIATVNGTEITLGQMIMARTTLPQQYLSLPDEVLFNGILDQLIQQSVLAQTVGDDTPRSVQIALENERRALLAAAVVDDILKDAVTDEALQKAYDEAFANAEPTREWNASHILVETEEEAAALIARLDAGEEFAALAQEASSDSSAASGGQLGWFESGMMVPDFEAAVIALEVGAVSAPVQTQFGWHVVMLNETRLREIPSLEQVADELRPQVERAAVQARLDELTAAATVERPGAGIDPALIKNLDLLEN